MMRKDCLLKKIVAKRRIVNQSNILIFCDSRFFKYKKMDYRSRSA